MSRLLRIDMPEADWDRLKALADAEGVTIGGYAKARLLLHLDGLDGIDTLADDEWSAMVRWLLTSGLAYPLNYPRRRSAVLSWARKHGFGKPED